MSSCSIVFKYLRAVYLHDTLHPNLFFSWPTLFVQARAVQSKRPFLRPDWALYVTAYDNAELLQSNYRYVPWITKLEGPDRLSKSKTATLR